MNFHGLLFKRPHKAATGLSFPVMIAIQITIVHRDAPRLIWALYSHLKM